MTTTLHIRTRAYPQGSKRHVGNGRMIEQAGANLTAYRQHVATIARTKLRNPQTGPVTIRCVFEFARPKTHYLRDQVRDTAPEHCYPAKRGDIDKLLRSTLDALTGVWFVDDAQVVGVAAAVRWASYDAITVTLTNI